MYGDLSCGEASEASCGFSVDTGIGGLNLMSMGFRIFAPLLEVPPAGARGTEHRLGSPRCARGTCRRGFRFPPLREGKRGDVAGKVYKRVRDDPTTFIEMRFSALLTILRRCGLLA